MSGLIMAGMLAGAGKGAAEVGDAMIKRRDDLAELQIRIAEARKLKEEEWAIRYGYDPASGASGGARGSRSSGGGMIDGVAADYLKRELSQGPTDRAQFERDEPLMVPNDEEGNPMPPSGKKVFDAGGYSEAERRRIERDLMIINRVRDPSAWDDVQKGKAQELLTGLADAANAEPDPAKREKLFIEGNKAAVLVGGGERFKQSANGMIVDIAAGDSKASALGEAKVETEKAKQGKEAALAAKAGRAPAGGGRSGGSGGSSTSVARVMTDEKGEVWAVMRDGTKRALGMRSGDFNVKIASEIAKMEKADYRFAKLPEEEKRARAIARITGQPAQASPAPAAAKPATTTPGKKDFSSLWK